MRLLLLLSACIAIVACTSAPSSEIVRKTVVLFKGLSDTPHFGALAQKLQKAALDAAIPDPQLVPAVLLAYNPMVSNSLYGFKAELLSSTGPLRVLFYKDHAKLLVSFDDHFPGTVLLELYNPARCVQCRFRPVTGELY